MTLKEIEGIEFAEWLCNRDEYFLKELTLKNPELKEMFIEYWRDDDERYWCEDCEEFAPLERIKVQRQTMIDPEVWEDRTTCCGVEI